MNSNPTNGILRQKQLSNRTDLHSHPSIREISLLLASGVLAITLYQLFHWPMKLPGRHGLEWMAILILARSLSHYSWAACVTAFGAAITFQTQTLGEFDPLQSLSYLIPAVIIDLLYRALSKCRQNIVFLALIAAIGHATRPLLHLVESNYLNIAHGSLNHGLGYPITSHLMFGFLGGLFGAILARASYLRETNISKNK